MRLCRTNPLARTPRASLHLERTCGGARSSIGFGPTWLRQTSKHGEIIPYQIRAAHAAQRSKRQLWPLTSLRCVRGSDLTTNHFRGLSPRLSLAGNTDAPVFRIDHEIFGLSVLAIDEDDLYGAAGPLNGGLKILEGVSAYAAETQNYIADLQTGLFRGRPFFHGSKQHTAVIGSFFHSHSLNSIAIKDARLDRHVPSIADEDARAMVVVVMVRMRMRMALARAGDGFVAAAGRREFPLARVGS